MAILKKSRSQFLSMAAVVAAGTAVLFIAVANTLPMQRAENITFDARIRNVDRKHASDPAVQAQAQQYVVIDIDNPSYDQLQEVFGRWPWPRQVWTEVVRWVDRGDPRLIALDIVFSGAQKDPGVDAEFARVMEHSGRVVLAYNMAPGVVMETMDDSLRTERLNIINKEAVVETGKEVGEREPVDKIAFNVPIARYAEAAAGMGVIRSVQDVDGVVRRVPIQFLTNGMVYASLNLRMAQLASLTGHEPLVRKGAVAANSRLRVPVDEHGRMILAWRLGTMKPLRIPIWQVICSIYPANCPQEVKRYKPDFFKDKIVMIAASAAASFDAHVMPLAGEDEKLPGFIVHMNAVENYLSGRAVRLPSQWVSTALIALMAFVGVAIFATLPSAVWSAVSVSAVALAYTWGASTAFERSYLWVPMMAPLSALAFAYIAAGVAQYATTGRELRRTRSTLNRYISPQLVDYVLEHRDTINLAGEKKELTILFSDVRNFTTITEGSDPMELIATLNEYLAEMTDVIFKYDGITDKFIGDGILAYWGAFTPEKNHAELACRAGLEMHERLDALNAKWKSEGRNPLAIGIGINTGEVVFGNVGSGRKIEFTVIGDAVNLAARLESQTKDFGVKILISEHTVAKAGGSIVAPALGGVKVKGKTVDTWVFELQSMAPEFEAHAEPASSGHD
jgi:adenylate cyclase